MHIGGNNADETGPDENFGVFVQASTIANTLNQLILGRVNNSCYSDWKEDFKRNPFPGHGCELSVESPLVPEQHGKKGNYSRAATSLANQTIAAGPLPGADQCIFRASLHGLFQVLAIHNPP